MRSITHPEARRSLYQATSAVEALIARTGRPEGKDSLVHRASMSPREVETLVQPNLATLMGQLGFFGKFYPGGRPSDEFLCWQAFALNVGRFRETILLDRRTAETIHLNPNQTVLALTASMPYASSRLITILDVNIPGIETHVGYSTRYQSEQTHLRDRFDRIMRRLRRARTTSARVAHHLANLFSDHSIQGGMPNSSLGKERIREIVEATPLTPSPAPTQQLSQSSNAQEFMAKMNHYVTIVL